MYGNIHVLNVHVNKFSWVPHKNILTQKVCQVGITVYVLPIKRLIATHTFYFATEIAMQSDPCSMLSIAIGGKRAWAKTFSN